jgi:hypothetical protein
LKIMARPTWESPPHRLTNPRRAEKASTPPAARDLLGDRHDVTEAGVRARLAAAPHGAQRELVRTLMTVTVHGARERGRKATDRACFARRRSLRGRMFLDAGAGPGLLACRCR